jgi:hypothetical protein
MKSAIALIAFAAACHAVPAILHAQGEKATMETQTGVRPTPAKIGRVEANGVSASKGESIGRIGPWAERL